jgi:hypothetical protein
MNGCDSDVVCGSFALMARMVKYYGMVVERTRRGRGAGLFKKGDFASRRARHALSGGDVEGRTCGRVVFGDRRWVVETRQRIIGEFARSQRRAETKAESVERWRMRRNGCKVKRNGRTPSSQRRRNDGMDGRRGSGGRERQT